MKHCVLFVFAVVFVAVVVAMLGGCTKKQSTPAPKASETSEVDDLARQISEEGTKSVPGLAPNPYHPNNLQCLYSDKAGKEILLKSEVFEVKEGWAISWVAGPPNKAPNESYFIVQLYRAEDKKGEYPFEVTVSLFSTLEMYKDEIESDYAIFGHSGRFYIKIRANVPFLLDVRKAPSS